MAFHIVELAMRLFPDLCGPPDGSVGEIFDILGRYFPIHFTHVSFVSTVLRILVCLNILGFSLKGSSCPLIHFQSIASF